MAKRLLDLLLASLGLILSAPLIGVAAIGIRLSSPGPILFRAIRAGVGGRPFVMYKLRSMRVQPHGQSAITAAADPRVFPFGEWLRRSKLDELPQFLNVLRGDMSIVGPRPEDPKFVEGHYGPLSMETLRVRPGLTSPASLYDYVHGEPTLTSEDVERQYVEDVLPIKLALEVVYVRRASVSYDVRLIGRTIWTIVKVSLGQRDFPELPEMAEARRLIPDIRGAVA
jgi:lipopolysaccharide/colanic/teichoic acid biosynthesis glycosyltransferase